MAPFALTAAHVWHGGYDLSGDTNQVSLNPTVADLDKTTFASGGWTEIQPGLKSVAFSHAGFGGYEDPDDTLFTNLGVSGQVVTVGPSGAVGDVAYTFLSTRSAYVPLTGAVGELAGISGTAAASSGTEGLVRGTILRPNASVNATSNGTGVQLGAVGATQFLYAAVHVFAAATTITLIVESDDNEAFTTATTRMTIGALTAVGGTWATRVAGAITDDWWRMRISAITGTFTIAGVVGIQ